MLDLSYFDFAFDLADQIVVLEQGEVVESGSHTELLAFKGRYAALWAGQKAETD